MYNERRPRKRSAPKKRAYQPVNAYSRASVNLSSYRLRTAAPKRWPAAVAVAMLALAVIGGVAGAYALVSSVSPHTVGGSGADGSLTASERAFDAPVESTDATSITLTFAGDCTLGTEESFDYATSFVGYYDERGPDYFFSGVKEIFDRDDLTIVNCEGVLTDVTTRDDKEYAYKGDPSYAEIFARSSIEAASISNNHIYDYGWGSRGDTINALSEAGIDVFGDEIIAYREVKGIKVALIGANSLSLGLGTQDTMTANISAAKDEGAQIIIVFMHWGIMSEYDPSDEQIELGRIAIDAGATLVVGSHPHVLQGYEKYNDRYIVYSLGNFCYGGSRGLHDPDCYIFQQTFTLKNGEIETDDHIEIVPCLISSSRDYNDYRPMVAEGADKERIESKIAKSSAGVAGRA